MKAEVVVFGEGARKIRNGSLILFNKWVRKIIGKPSPGDLVNVFDEEGNFLGCGLYETLGPIAVRLLTHNEFYGDKFEIFTYLLEKAIMRRKIIGYYNTGFYRLINSDGDFIPGLIIDVYNDIIVLQSSSQAIDAALKDIIESIVEVYGKDITIYEKSDQKSRSDIGLPFRRRFI
ncbi:MAG: class I SAM-dependent rRNA methyltransferase, partial [Thermoprotei archaeon]